MYNGMESYKSTDVLTAKKTRLVLMMYDGAIRFAEEGIKRIESKDIKGRGIYIGKSQRVVQELLNCLDIDNGGEIAGNLYRLYVFINRNLTMANIQGEKKFIEDSIVVLKNLREGWKGITENSGRESTEYVKNAAKKAPLEYNKLAIQA